MLNHVSCEMPKQKIIETIVSEFDRTYALVKENPTERNLGREEALRDLLKLIPIFEYN